MRTKSRDRSGTIACAGATGSLGLAALAGACSSGCSLIAAPILGLLSSAGLGSVAALLPSLRPPLIIVAMGLGAISLWSFARRKNVIGTAVCGCLLGAGATFLGWQATQANDCKRASTIEGILKNLSPEAKQVFQKGVYPLWPELGRAPTIAEIQQRLGLASEEKVLAAFEELEGMGFHNVFYSGTKTIKWFWPFSSLDHGVDVVLDGEKSVHARCAIDALGMSAMFGKRAKLSIKSPLDGQHINMEIDSDRLMQTDQEVVVSFSDSCDNMLFFASRDEYNRYVKQTGKTYLKLYTLKQALDRGVQSFGRVLKV